MRKPILAILAMGLVASLAPLSAHASHCDSHVIMFPSPYGLNANVLTCFADEGEDIDGRIIPPGSTGITVAYTVDLGAEVPYVWANISGSLFPAGKRVKLPRIQLTGGSFRYEGSAQSFPPPGRTASGCVTATVEVLDDELNTNTYKHLNATC